MPKLIRNETHIGSPVIINGLRLLPFATSIYLTFPIIRFGLVWNRPVSILMIRPDGEEQVIRVRDRTREIVWTINGAIAILAAMIALFEHRRRNNQ